MRAAVDGPAQSALLSRKRRHFWAPIAGFLFLLAVAAIAIAGGLIATLPRATSNGVNSVTFSPAGPTLVTGDDNGSVYLWSTATHNLLATMHLPGAGCQRAWLIPYRLTSAQAAMSSLP